MFQDIFKAKKERILSCFNDDTADKKIKKFDSLPISDMFIPDDTVSAERYKVAYMDYLEAEYQKHKESGTKESFDTEDLHNSANQFALEATKKNKYDLPQKQRTY